MSAPYCAARLAAAVLLLTPLLALTACGYKGDLVLPPNVAAAPSPAPTGHPPPLAGRLAASPY